MGAAARVSGVTEHRSLHGGLSVRSKARGEIDVRAVTYGVVDSYGSLWAPGCLTEHFNRRQPSICWGHDTSDIIGRGISWRDTSAGPVVTARLDNDPRVPWAQQAIAQIDSGTLDDVSVAFSNAERRAPHKHELMAWPTAREVIEYAEVGEISLVFEGAVPGAKVLAMRSAAGAHRLAAALATGQLTPAQWRARRSIERGYDAEIERSLAEADRILAQLGRR